MLLHDKPPRQRLGFRWEWREGCQCEKCPWKGNCKGEDTPHWREVREGMLDQLHEDNMNDNLSPTGRKPSQPELQEIASHKPLYNSGVLTEFDYVEMENRGLIGAG